MGSVLAFKRPRRKSISRQYRLSKSMHELLLQIHQSEARGTHRGRLAGLYNISTVRALVKRGLLAVYNGPEYAQCGGLTQICVTPEGRYALTLNQD